MSRDYAEAAALKLVGDRHQLVARQRAAVSRAACLDHRLAGRRERALQLEHVAGQTLLVDGFNALIVTESALSGRLVFTGRDRAHRDLASVHGAWRSGLHTSEAIDALGHALSAAGPREVRWLLDRPVSNSGRLRALLLERAEAHGWPWSVDLLDAPDQDLARSGAIVASADAWVLDHAPAWVDLPGAVAAARRAWVVDLSS